MADGQTAEGGAQQVEGGKPQGTPAEPDYKALYEAENEAKEKAIAESRKWEGRSKAIKAASAKAEKTAEERIADLESKLSEKERAEELAKLKAKVAQKKGVDADLLVGETEEEMEAWADKLLKAFKTKPAATVDKPGAFAPGSAPKGDFIREEFMKHRR